MKLFLPLILVLLYPNREASCFGLYDYVSDKVNEFKNSIIGVFTSISDKFDLFMSTLVEDKGPALGLIGFNSKCVKSFSEFVVEEAAKSEVEFPEYYSLRSEPTALMSTPQLATLHGKRVESHIVVTDDGYLLTIHRIRIPKLVKRKNKSNKSSFTILMHHGLLGSSADWILLGPKKSLPYILSNAGYDVWLTNARGNYYSRGHTSLKVDSLEYWNFSWEQMGSDDLPAVVNYIKKIKNSTERLTFIGHSMGATAFLAMLSADPRYNDYFKMGILLAPLVYMTNIMGPIRTLAAVAKSPPLELVNILGRGEFLPSRVVPLWIANKYCKGPDIYCINPLIFLSGSIPKENSWSKNFTARVLYHVPAGGSTNTILHYAAMVKAGTFQDYNNEEFPLHRISVPIAIFSSDSDWLATKTDVRLLYLKIPKPINHYVIQEANFSHTDFVWHPEGDHLVFSKVVECVENDLNSFEHKN
ncbi:lipase 3-like [Pararge aegeria]|uniref:Jg13066 protein n=1 Tax=Pararge aegeria aegeria TaxID=348720 RepID=A0A8S4QVR6_9NEOP|nr:lipase 3-like [Pararge aegeria]CAH2220349.1 jg13066 [Pararge aegeria aegeria]